MINLVLMRNFLQVHLNAANIQIAQEDKKKLIAKAKILMTVNAVLGNQSIESHSVKPRVIRGESISSLGFTCRR